MAKIIPIVYQVDTWGVNFSIPVTNMPNDIAAIRLLIAKPDGTTFIDKTWQQSGGTNTGVSWDPTAKVLTWAVASGDLNLPGDYKYQVIDVTTGRQIPTGVQTFTCVDNVTDLPPVTP